MTDAETILKPCPFCGGAAKIVSNMGQPNEFFLIYHDCEALGGEVFEIDMNETDQSAPRASEAWNTRTVIENEH